MNLKSLYCASFALLSALASYAGADLTEGAVYRFINIAHNFEITAPKLQGSITATTDADTARRLWVVEHVRGGEGFYLRDLRYGTYMTSPIAQSKEWFVTFTNTPDPNTMAFVLTDETLTNTAMKPVGYNPTVHVGNSGFAHANGSGANGTALVCWNSTDNPSRWQIALADMTDDEIQAYRSTWPSPTGPVQANRVYRITNKQHGHALKASNLDAVATAVNDSDKGQLWITEPSDNGIVLRNFKNGGVLTSSMKTSEQWTIDYSDAPNLAKSEMYIEETPEGYVFQPKSVKGQGYQFAHEAGDATVVCWETGAEATRWNFTLMPNITEADIEAQKQLWDTTIDTETIGSALNEIFSDKACTILSATFSAMSLAEIQASDAYQDLPTELRQMVFKVKSGDWSETDPTNPVIEWDGDHAKKFRVQLYEPYSDCVSASQLTCIHRYTNLNNPTGLVADEGTTLYVMVDKSADPGATLYLALRSYDDSVDAINKTTDGTELHEGLNVITSLDNNVLPVIYYTVTTNQGRQKIRPLTEFNDIKIHIEGGSVNGFFNSAGDELYTADNNQDWFYYRDRARFNRFPLISKHCILYFDFLDIIDDDGNPCVGLKNLLTAAEYQSGNFDLNATMKAWDDMFVAEMLVMGLMPDDVINAEKTAGRDWYDTIEGDAVAPSDYSLYFNNRLMGITEPRGFMSATWYRTTYHVNTLRTIVMEFPTMDLWGPAHEFGHMNQAPMNLVGCTEESNNVFSNVALFYRGSSTSRAEYPYVQREKFNQGATFLDHDTWGTTRMWFQLWLYYHAAGNNKKFYPRLYELLRQNPLDHSDRNHINAKDDQLHFAKMACMAAGEDLTDFFDAWGFLQPMDGRVVEDYSTYTVYLSDEEIETWREEIAQLAKENNWEKNTAIIFIDDRVGEIVKPGHSEFPDKSKAGEMGGLNDFINRNNTVSGEYTFSLTGSTVKVSGATGGAGFLIYDENDRLIGFSNEKTFDVSPEAAQKLLSGEASFYVVNTNSEEAVVNDALKDASLAEKLQTLKDGIARAEEIDALADYTETRVGYLKPSTVANLKIVADNIRSQINDNKVTEENIDELLLALNTEMIYADNIPLNEETTITLKPNGTYVFVSNYMYSALGIQAAKDGQTVIPTTAGNLDLTDPAQQWVFEPAADGTGFYIRSVAQDKYIDIPDQGSVALPLSDTPLKFTPTVDAPGFISLAGDKGSGTCIHAQYYYSYTIVRWGDTEPSRWSLTMVDDPELREAKQALTEKIAATRVLANELADNRENTYPIELNESNYSSNANGLVANWSVLYDKDPDTYFESNGDVDSDHHIKIRLPLAIDEEDTHLILTYQTRNDATSTLAPTKAVIEYSADDEEWVLAHSLTQKHLPTLHNQTFKSETFAVPAGTSYVRFTVNKSLTSSQTLKARAAADHATFCVSELGLASHVIFSEPNTDLYPNSNAEDVSMALRQCRNSEVTLNAPGASADDINAAIEAVEPHYQTLLKLKNSDITLGIDKINAAEGSAAIFDLQGRRLNNANRPGIYIINGKKTVKGSED